MRNELETDDLPPTSRTEEEADRQWNAVAGKLLRVYRSTASATERRQMAAELFGDIISAERRHPSHSPLESAAPGIANPAAPVTTGDPWDDPRAATQFLLSNSLFQEDDPLMAYARARRLALEAATRAFEEWKPEDHPRGGKNPGWFRTTTGGDSLTGDEPTSAATDNNQTVAFQQNRPATKPNSAPQSRGAAAGGA